MSQDLSSGARNGDRSTPMQLLVENRVIEVNGKAASVLHIGQKNGFSGARRDTIHIPGNTAQVTIAFDADNPGDWLMHCHNLYHAKAGMLTSFHYMDIPKVDPNS